MAHSTPIDPDALTQIADQVGASLPTGLSPLAGKLELGESFDVWNITTPLVKTDDMSTIAHFTGAFHHQILRHDTGDAVGFARSRPAGNLVKWVKWDVTQVVLSHRAQKSAKAVADADVRVTEDVLARTILVPGNLVHWEVTQVFRSPLAKKIQEAIADVDLQVPEDVLARLVLVPEYQTSVFWFVETGAHRCYVIARPKTFKALREKVLLPGADFLARLRKEKPVRGLLFKRPVKRRVKRRET